MLVKCIRVAHILVASHVLVLDAGQHDLLPGLACRAPEQQQHGPAEALEIVVTMNVGVVIERDPAEDLHPDHTIDEKHEGDEDGDPGQSLEGLKEGPEKSSDPLVLVQKLHQPRDTKQSQEPDRSITVGLK